MRVFVVHDSAGNISEVITFPDDAAPPMVGTALGFSMSEIDAPSDVPAEELQSPEGVAKFVEKYRIQAAEGKGALKLR